MTEREFFDDVRGLGWLIIHLGSLLFVIDYVGQIRSSRRKSSQTSAPGSVKALE